MFSFQNMGIKIALAITLILSVVGVLKYQSSKIEKLEATIQEKDENFEKAVNAYEYSLMLERESAAQNAITQEQKEVVVKKTNTLKQAIIKRGKINEDSSTDYAVVSF